jgi:hypothetical protein
MNLLSVEVCGFVFTIRLYPERGWGRRGLGSGRRAFDVWYFGFLFEKYSYYTAQYRKGKVDGSDSQ